jgi:hypothetical protein
MVGLLDGIGDLTEADGRRLTSLGGGNRGRRALRLVTGYRYGDLNRAGVLSVRRVATSGAEGEFGAPSWGRLESAFGGTVAILPPAERGFDASA